MRFRIITDSWNKTDRQDARNMAKALWVFLVTGEFGIPTVYKPSETIRTLRRLFASYTLRGSPNSHAEEHHSGNAHRGWDHLEFNRAIPIVQR
ncbi:MAG: hypothetical protein KGZ25_11155 [Planctomycetes bacterium]|nr:hypothetical protein [Planctomycetota bacterium]